MDVTYTNFDIIKIDVNSLNIKIINNNLDENNKKILKDAIITFKNFYIEETEESYSNLIKKINEKFGNIKFEYKSNLGELIIDVNLNNFLNNN